MAMESAETCRAPFGRSCSHDDNGGPGHPGGRSELFLQKTLSNIVIFNLKF